VEVGVAPATFGIAMGGPVDPVALVSNIADTAERLGFSAM